MVNLPQEDISSTISGISGSTLLNDVKPDASYDYAYEVTNDQWILQSQNSSYNATSSSAANTEYSASSLTQRVSKLFNFLKPHMKEGSPYLENYLFCDKNHRRPGKRCTS